MIKKILENFGHRNQAIKLQEEAEEFLESATNYAEMLHYGTIDVGTVDDLISEYVDITILFEQMMIIHNVDQLEILKVRNRKIDRTLKIIERMKKENKTYEEIRKEY